MSRQTVVLAALAVAALLAAERRWPARARTQAEPRRALRNVVLGGLAMGVVAAVQTPLATRLSARVEGRRQGLAQALPRAWQRDAAAFLLLDWSMYGWHVATHRSRLLWRLHAVHHVDLDMDASTALRFHAADMALSVGLRLVQIRVLGVSPRALAAWEAFFFASVLFHHSNLRLPGDAALAWLLTTPGMHDIHHRASPEATGSNWSSGLSLWDRLHGTFNAVRPDAGMGIAAFREVADTRLAVALALPLMPQREAWPR